MIDELLEEVKESDALSDTAAEQFYTFAFAQYRCGDLTKASDAFQILCARKPLEARFWFGLGATLQEDRNYKGAMKAWAMAALLDLKDPYPHFHAAECACSLVELKDAKYALLETEKRISEDHPLKDKVRLLKEAWDL